MVDNKGGASGSIGTGRVAAASAQGPMFAVVCNTHAVTPASIATLPFHTRRDLGSPSPSPPRPSATAARLGQPRPLAVTLLAKGVGFELTHIPTRAAARR